jgi:hypothetical protein
MNLTKVLLPCCHLSSVGYLAITGRNKFYMEMAANVGSPGGELEVVYSSLTQRAGDGGKGAPVPAVFDRPEASSCHGNCQLPEFMTAMTVVALGDLDADTGKYSWMACSDPAGVGTMICARDPTVFEALYQDEVLLRLENLGFDSCLTQPIPVYHGEDCAYGFASPTSEPSEQPVRTPKPHPDKTRPPHRQSSMRNDMFEYEE